MQAGGGRFCRKSPCVQSEDDGMNRCVVTFGELLMRLDTPGKRRFVQSDSLGISFTGGEANVAVALARWGLPTRMVSKVPSHDLGEACLDSLRRYGVATDHVLRGGDRLGLLFVEGGMAPRPTRVIYDRLHTSFREMQAGEIDWSAILAEARWLHVTGTAPAFGSGTRSVLREALDQAAGHGVTVSFDCSFRSSLWSASEAAEVFCDLMQYVDVFIGSERDAQTFFGVPGSGDASLHGLREKFGLQTVAYAHRTESSHGTSSYSACVLHGDQLVTTRPIEGIVVDRIGMGDAFAAGLIRGLIMDRPTQETADFAVAAGVLTQTLPGDFCLVSVDEVNELARDQTGGQVRR